MDFADFLLVGDATEEDVESGGHHDGQQQQSGEKVRHKIQAAPLGHGVGVAVHDVVPVTAHRQHEESDQWRDQVPEAEQVIVLVRSRFELGFNARVPGIFLKKLFTKKIKL